MTPEEKEATRKARKRANNERLLAEPWREGDIAKDWWKRHCAKPWIYKDICDRADSVIRRGFPEYSIDTIISSARFHSDVTKGPTDEFKFYNVDRAYYARLWLEEHPDYPIFFTLHTLTSQKYGPRDRYGRHPDDFFDA
jgi:hypothetical protein